MKTFFLGFKVTPTTANSQYHLVEGAIANCIVLESSPESAANKARFFVLKNEWQIESLDTYPAEVEETDFIGKDIGQEQFLKAQESGISIFYCGWSKDGKTTIGPISLENTSEFNLNQYINNQKTLRQKGRCLHYDSGSRCQSIISAHSIQKSGLLSLIASEGHVYTISNNMGSLKTNSRKISFDKIGINKVSTFFGFCQIHDNDLFECIDNAPLTPTKKQIFLYAYRSVCRELFVKENALDLLNNQLELASNSGIKSLLESMGKGTALGLDNLKRHKSAFDKSLREKSYNDIQYALFISKQDINIGFSGLFYPDFDFIGCQLQNLANPALPFDLMTICSCPMDKGWGFLFSWHKTSEKICSQFMSSLATALHEGKDIGDGLFRLVISSCENIAISPQWWENLSSVNRDDISTQAFGTADIFHDRGPQYLMHGLEGISRWIFDEVLHSPSQPPKTIAPT